MAIEAKKHLEALRISGLILASLNRMYWPKAAKIKPEKVVRIIHQTGARFVVIGSQGINGYRSEFMATHDVDFLMRGRYHKRAIAGIRKAFPKLVVEEKATITRFIDPGVNREVIDLIKPHLPLHELIFKNSLRAGEFYRIPNLEMALADKFVSMISPDRELSKRYLDAGTFANVVRQHYDEIDLVKLEHLGEAGTVNGGSKILDKVQIARRDGPSKFSSDLIQND